MSSTTGSEADLGLEDQAGHPKHPQRKSVRAGSGAAIYKKGAAAIVARRLGGGRDVAHRGAPPAGECEQPTYGSS